MICVGVAYLALFGFGSAPLPGLDIAMFGIVVAWSGISGLFHGYRWNPELRSAIFPVLS